MDIKKIIESILSPTDLDGDVTEPKDIFNGLKDSVVLKAASVLKLFAKRSDIVVTILDREGKNFITLRKLSRGVSLEILFPGETIPEVKIFNHWNEDYTSEILNAITTIVKGIQSGKNIVDLKNWYKREMGSY